jgi:hypothetical protein
MVESHEGRAAWDTSPLSAVDRAWAECSTITIARPHDLGDDFADTTGAPFRTVARTLSRRFARRNRRPARGSSSLVRRTVHAPCRIGAVSRIRRSAGTTRRWRSTSSRRSRWATGSVVTTGRRPCRRQVDTLRVVIGQLLWSGRCPLDRKEMNVSSDRPIRQSDPASDIKPQVADL